MTILPPELLMFFFFWCHFLINISISSYQIAFDYAKADFGTDLAISTRPELILETHDTVLLIY